MLLSSAAAEVAGRTQRSIEIQPLPDLIALRGLDIERQGKALPIHDLGVEQDGSTDTVIVKIKHFQQH